MTAITKILPVLRFLVTEGDAMNVLLTCADNHDDLVEAVREALFGVGQVFAADSQLSVAGLQEADAVVLLPPVGDAHYIDALLAFLKQQPIDVLLPLSEVELPLLSTARAELAALGTLLLASPDEVIGRTLDKWQSTLWLKEQGFSGPRGFLALEPAVAALSAGEITFPLVVKPRFGTAAAAVQVVHDLSALELCFKLLERTLGRTLWSGIPGLLATDERLVLIQEFVSGEELELTVLNTLEGSYAATFALRKLAQRRGALQSAETIADARLQDLGARLGAALGHVGPLSCDVMVQGDSYDVLDLNACLQPSYAFSHAAGANLPAALFAWLRQEPIDPLWLQARAGFTVSRSSRLLLVQEP